MNMSEIRKKMALVADKDLMDKDKFQEHKAATRLPGGTGSMSNHIDAYRQMMGINENVQPKQNLEENKFKAAGALEVAKELLAEASPKNAMDTMSKLKQILKDF